MFDITSRRELGKKMLISSVILKIIGNCKIKDKKNCTLVDKLSSLCPKNGTQVNSSEITLHGFWGWMVVKGK